MKLSVALLFCFLLSGVFAQGRAYRNIQFGNSVSEVTQQVLEDEAFVNQFDRPVRMDTSVPEKILELQTQYVYIGGERYAVHFSFYDDKLFRLTFYSDDFNANFFDTSVAGLRDILVKTISAAHGTPDRTYNLSFFDMTSGRIAWSHTWDTDSSGTAYKIGIGERESTYYGAMFIEWTWLTNLYEANLNSEQDEGISDSADDF